MNHVQIQHFLTIVKYMSITKAARELYITQPALSHSLSKIESELGLTLFRRDGNRIYLTHKGEELYEKFEKVNDAYSQLFEKAQSLEGEDEETITVGFSGSAPIFFAMFTSGFLATYRGIPIKKVYADYQQLKQFLLAKQIDFAITYPPITDGKIGCRSFLKDELVLAVSNSHPLAAKETITAEDLEHYQFTLLRSSNPFRRLCDELLRQKGITIQLKGEYDYSEFVRLVDLNRNGSGFLTFTVPNSFPKWFGDGYVCRTISDCKMYQITAVSWLLENNKNKKYNDLIDMIERHYREEYDKADCHAFMLYENQ